MSALALRAGRRRLLSVFASSLILSGLLPAAAAPVLAAPTDLFISEYVEGSSNNKAVEIYNGTGSAVDLTGYSVQMFFNGSPTSGLTINLVGTVEDGDVWIVANSNAAPAILAVGNQFNASGFFNGDDAVALVKNGTPIDIIGQIGVDPGTAWSGGGVSTVDTTLRRKTTIQAGDPNGIDAFDPSVEWNAFAIDTFDGLGGHSITSDAAPFVSSTTPLNGATAVAINTTPTVTFSESVTLSAATIHCDDQGDKIVSVPGGAALTFSLTTAAFQNDDHCTVTIAAAAVSDADTDDPPDTMAGPFTWSFDTAPSVTTSPIVINEVDYDQPGIDTAEYLELKNVSGAAVDLDPYAVRLVNGSGGGTMIYTTVDLPAVSLAAGDWYVICGDVPSVPGCDLDGGNATDFIQNGAPDGIGLLLSGTVVDAVSYEGNTGAPYTEASGVGVIDSGANAGEGISRCIDGTDTNVNNVDFLTRPNTVGARNACPGDDAAPDVASTFPVDGATDVGVGANLSVTFTEDVTVTDPWFELVCNGLAKAATYSGGPATFTIDPTEDFADGDACALTVFAAQVHDTDATDPPDNMTVNFVVDFSAFDVCVQDFTPIYAIQGAGDAAAITGNVTTAGVVVGDFEGAAANSGFFIQDPTGDGDAATSDGIFVFTGSANVVNVGDLVRVTGFARERFNQTTINGSNSNSAAVPAGAIVNCGSSSVAPTDVTLPFSSSGFPERFEGMLVNFPQSLVISEYFNYDRFGELVLALPLDGEDRPFTGTAIDEPGAAANARTAANLLRRITLDDNQSAQNPPVLRHPNGQPFSLTNRFRGGDTVANATGVLGFDFSLYRIFPTAPADYTPVNPRTATPDDVGGTIRAAAMNTLNFFLTLDTTANDNGPGPCGGNANLDCRGADSDQPDEFPRQRTKLLQALAGLDADVIGLNELENTPGVEPLLDPNRGIVAGLNDLGAGPFAAVDTGVIGTDAIRVGIIYRSDVLRPVGPYKILNSTVDPRFLDTKNRPSLAQTFDVIATGARFTVVVNHLKSKGSDCNDVGDPDAGDGQGNCNGTRTKAARALADWIATDPTGSGDRDYLVLGDLNSYARENPVSAIRAGADDTAGNGDDFTNLIAKYQGPYAHSYVFDGQAGYLDHALASPTLVGQVTGAADWHINSDEPDILDYDTSFKPPAQEALYEPNQYRTSDHDPVVVGLNLLSYKFNGFESPVDNPPIVNGVKLGQSVPVKFQLAGDLGLGVLFGTPTASQHECDVAGGLPDPLETTATAGSSGLQYDPATNTYTYVWKTDKTWSPGCRTFEITFDDGTYRRAQFQFTK